MKARAISAAEKQVVLDNTSGSAVVDVIDLDVLTTGTQTRAQIEEEKRARTNPILASRGLSGAPSEVALAGRTSGDPVIGSIAPDTATEIDPHDLAVSTSPDPKRGDFGNWLGNDTKLSGARPPTDPTETWGVFDEAENPFSKDAEGHVLVRPSTPSGIAAMQEGAVLLGAEKRWEELEAAGKPFAPATRKARARVDEVRESGVPMME